MVTNSKTPFLVYFLPVAEKSICFEDLFPSLGKSQVQFFPDLDKLHDIGGLKFGLRPPPRVVLCIIYFEVGYGTNSGMIPGSKLTSVHSCASSVYPDSPQEPTASGLRSSEDALPTCLSMTRPDPGPPNSYPLPQRIS